MPRELRNIMRLVTTNAAHEIETAWNELDAEDFQTWIDARFPAMRLWKKFEDAGLID